MEYPPQVDTHVPPEFVNPLLQVKVPPVHVLHDVEHVGDVSIFPDAFVQAALRVCEPVFAFQVQFEHVPVGVQDCGVLHELEHDTHATLAVLGFCNISPLPQAATFIDCTAAGTSLPSVGSAFMVPVVTAVTAAPVIVIVALSDALGTTSIGLVGIVTGLVATHLIFLLELG